LQPEFIFRYLKFFYLSSALRTRFKGQRDSAAEETHAAYSENHTM